MALKDVLQQALDKVGWKDTITQDDSSDTHFIKTGYSIGGQSYLLTIRTDEALQRMAVQVRCPIAIPRARQKDGAIVINALNVSMVAGNFEFLPDGALFYRWAIDVDGTAPSPEQILVLIRVAGDAFDDLTVSTIGKVAFTTQPGEEIVAKFIEASEQLNAQTPNESS